MKITEQIEVRQKVLTMMAFLTDPDEALDLLSYCSEEEVPQLTKIFQEFKSKTNKKQFIVSELKRISGESRKNVLSEVHVDWILESLKKESPRVIATILRYLPAIQVSAILEKLPHSILHEMPPLNQTFSLDPEIVQLLKKLFENKFLTLPSESSQSLELSFHRIPYFSLVKLEVLFREIGLRELSMAFTTLNEKTVHLLLNRMPPRDANIVRTNLENKESVSTERRKQAQSHLLSLELGKGAADHLVLETGFFVYSKAILPSDVEEVKAIEQKFSREKASVLKHYVAKNLPFNSEKSVLRYQREILSLIEKLQAPSEV